MVIFGPGTVSFGRDLRPPTAYQRAYYWLVAPLTDMPPPALDLQPNLPRLRRGILWLDCSRQHIRRLKGASISAHPGFSIFLSPHPQSFFHSSASLPSAAQEEAHRRLLLFEVHRSTTVRLHPTFKTGGALSPHNTTFRITMIGN
jgi:hypothetical protein